MSIIRSIARRARRFASACVLGGPVGLFYAVKLARIRHRLARASTRMAREKERHRASIRALADEWADLIAAQQSANAAAGQFWHSCGQPGEPS